MLPLPPTNAVVPRRLPTPIDHILINAQPLQPHRPPRMDLIRRDADFGAKPKTHSIRHSSTRVPEDARTVHACLEALGEVRGRSEDRVGVMGGVGINVGDGEVQGVGEGGDGFDGEDGSEEFSCKILFYCFLQQHRFVLR